MFISRLAILFMLFYIASNQYGVCFIPRSAPPIDSMWGLWVMNQVLGLMVSALFASLWTFKTVSDHVNQNKELEL
jgi:hypothetical protein